MIDTQAIRSKILDLAMRGKLTEQLPEDGTAEELFRQIQAEKQALIKAGKIKKEKPLPEILTQDQPFAIPQNWKWVRLGTLLRVISGISYEKSDVSTNGLRILRGGNIQNMGITLDHSDVFLPFGYKDEDKIVCKGDVIIVASTGSETAIGRAGYADKDYESTMIGAFLRICRPIAPAISMYIRAIFMSNYYLQHIRHESKGTNINNVKEKYITHFVVPLPPLAEQHRIVARIEQAFSALDTIDALQAKYADNLAVLKSKLIDSAIQGKLTEQLPEDGSAEELYRQIQTEKQALIKAGKIKKEKPLPEITADEIPFEIPANWKWARLGNLMLDVSTGPFGSMLHESDYCEGGVPLVNPMHIQNGAIHPSDKMRVSASTLERLSQYRLSEGMIVVARRGDLGRCARVGKTEDGWLCGTGCFFLNPSRHVFGPFITLVISSPFARSVFRGTAIGTTMANLNHNLLKGLAFPLPPLAEQKRIVAKLEGLLQATGDTRRRKPTP